MFIEEYGIKDKIALFVFLMIIAGVVVSFVVSNLFHHRYTLDFQKDKLIIYSKNPMDYDASLKYMFSGVDKFKTKDMIENLKKEGNVSYLLSKSGGNMAIQYKDIDSIYSTRRFLSFFTGFVELRIVVNGKVLMLGGVKSIESEKISKIMGRDFE